MPTASFARLHSQTEVFFVYLTVANPDQRDALTRALTGARGMNLT